MEIIKESVLQFEYKIMTYYGLMEEMVTQDILKKKNTSSEDVLNELGKDGWELFTILQGKENCLFIFKRSKWVEKKAQEEQGGQTDGSLNGEDEKIRKAILDFITDEVNFNTKLTISRTEAFKWIFWLEKQGNKVVDCQQNHEDVHPNGCIVLEDFNGGEGFYKVHLDYLNKKQVEEIEEMVRTWNVNKKELEKIENYTAWSEEDENNLTDTCVAIRKFYHRNNGAQDLIDWLKSLKERMKGEKA